MPHPTRIHYTAADKALMWERWQQGESLNAIARHFGRSHASIQGAGPFNDWLAVRVGWKKPTAPARSRRATRPWARAPVPVFDEA